MSTANAPPAGELGPALAVNEGLRRHDGPEVHAAPARRGSRPATAEASASARAQLVSVGPAHRGRHHDLTRTKGRIEPPRDAGQHDGRPGRRSLRQRGRRQRCADVAHARAHHLAPDGQGFEAHGGHEGGCRRRSVDRGSRARRRLRPGWTRPEPERAPRAGRSASASSATGSAVAVGDRVGAHRGHARSGQDDPHQVERVGRVERATICPPRSVRRHPAQLFDSLGQCVLLAGRNR